MCSVPTEIRVSLNLAELLRIASTVSMGRLEKEQGRRGTALSRGATPQ